MIEHDFHLAERGCMISISGLYDFHLARAPSWDHMLVIIMVFITFPSSEGSELDYRATMLHIPLRAPSTVFVITFGSAGNMAVPKRIISRGSSPLPDLFRVAVQ